VFQLFFACVIARTRSLAQLPFVFLQFMDEVVAGQRDFFVSATGVGFFKLFEEFIYFLMTFQGWRGSAYLVVIATCIGSWAG